MASKSKKVAKTSNSRGTTASGAKRSATTAKVKKVAKAVGNKGSARTGVMLGMAAGKAMKKSSATKQPNGNKPSTLSGHREQRMMTKNQVSNARKRETVGMAKEHYGNDVAKPAIKKTASVATRTAQKATGISTAPKLQKTAVRKTAKPLTATAARKDLLQKQARKTKTTKLK